MTTPHIYFSSVDFTLLSSERRGLILESKQPTLYHSLSGQIIEADGLKGKLGESHTTREESRGGSVSGSEWARTGIHYCNDYNGCCLISDHLELYVKLRLNRLD